MKGGILMYKVYICTKASDIVKGNDFFQHIIAYYGIPSKTTDVFCQDFRCDVHYSDKFTDFVVRKMKRLCIEQNNISFYFYAPKFAYCVINKEPKLANYICCLNSEILLQQLDNKIIARFWAKEYVNVVPFKILTINSCLSELRTNKMLAGLVIQYPDSVGGEGTYILSPNYNDKNEKGYFKDFSKDIFFLVSPFLKDAISATCHIIVYEENTLVFPIGISQTIITDEIIQRPIYQGTEYRIQNLIKQNIIKKIRNCIKNIGHQLATIGYRGICGIDFMVNNNDIYIMEFNPRFLGSSFIVDMALIDNHLPSLAYFNEEAFIKSSPLSEHIQKVQELSIPYSSHVFAINEHFSQNTFNILINNIPPNWTVFFDGLNQHIPIVTYENDTYLFRAAEKNI